MEYRLISYVKSNSEEQIRYALQNLFWNATKGVYIPKHLFPFDRLEELILSKNDKVRKWAYYVTCFYCNIKIFNKAKVNIFLEENELIRSWMLATIYTYDFHFYKNFIRKKDVGLSENSVHLLTNLFHRNEDEFKIDKKFLNKVVDSDDILAKFWLTFFYKYRPYIEKKDFRRYNNQIPKCFISCMTNLTNTSNIETRLFEVEEYALSALNHYCPDFSFNKDVKFNIGDIDKKKSNPRKWAYTLIWKDAVFIKRNLDFVKDLMFANKLKLKDREGFAKGLFDNGTFDKQLESNIIEWYLKEDDIIVTEYLKNYMKKNIGKSLEFHKQIQEYNNSQNQEGQATNNYYLYNSVLADNTSNINKVKINVK